MKNEDVEKYVNRINISCCDHKKKQYKYFLGYTGYKFFKVSMCLDCEKVQFLGNKFLTPFYYLARVLFRGRIDIEKMVYIDYISETGECLDGFCVICGKRIPIESGKQYCTACKKRYLEEEEYNDNKKKPKN